MESFDKKEIKSNLICYFLIIVGIMLFYGVSLRVFNVVLLATFSGILISFFASFFFNKRNTCFVVTGILGMFVLGVLLILKSWGEPRAMTWAPLAIVMGTPVYFVLVYPITNIVFLLRQKQSIQATIDSRVENKLEKGTIPHPLNVYFSWKGRISRKTYWIYFVPIILILVVNEYFIGSINQHLYFAVLIAVLYPSVMINIKRAHDRSRTGFFSLLLVLPIISVWPLVELGFLVGSEGDNKYGIPDIW